MPIIGTIASSVKASPFVPTIGTATAGNAQASVTFTPNPLGPVATSYTVLSTPGSITATGASSPITITGLSNGTAYTFQVRANNAFGSSAYSSSSNSVTPVAPVNQYVKLTDINATATSPVDITNLNTYWSEYKYLEIWWNGRTTSSIRGGDWAIRINNSSSAVYDWHWYQMPDGAQIVDNDSTLYASIVGASDPNNTRSPLSVYLPNYGANIANQVIINSGWVNNDTSFGKANSLTGGLGTAAAITSINFTNLPVTGRFTIYGIKG